MLQQRPAQNTGTTWHACTNILPSRHLSITNTSHISLLFCSSFPPNLPELLDGLLAVCAHEIQQVHDTQKLLERESQLLQQELSTLTAELSGWASKTQVRCALLCTICVWQICMAAYALD
jgi:hypothetical protein